MKSADKKRVYAGIMICAVLYVSVFPVYSEATAGQNTAIQPNQPAAADSMERQLQAANPSGNTAEAEIPPAFTIPQVFSSFKMIPRYYGLPLSVQLGWFYRNRNTSIFPHTGMTFTVEDTPVFNTSAGFTFQHKMITWYAAAVYDIVPFSMHKPAHEQIFYGTTVLSAALPNVKVSFPLRAGRQRTLLQHSAQGEGINTSNAGGIPPAEIERIAVTEYAAGIQFDFFLADFGFFRSTGTASMTYHIIPQDKFQYYTVTAGIPASFHLYYADIAFMYSFFYTDMLYAPRLPHTRRYEIGKTQETLTGRSSFKMLPRYRNMHLFGTECRWYPARLTAQTNGFFLSVFADTGLGITEAKKTGFLWECGGGIGYTLLDSVPFTIQAGINQNLQPVLYLTAVSRFVHLP